MNRICVLIMLLSGAWSPIQADPKQPIYMYARAGDPLRIVYSIRGHGSMGIAGEGPLRARCFVIGPSYRDLSLGTNTLESERLPSIQALEKALDLRDGETPPDLVTIWKGESPGWTSYRPGDHVPVSGVEPTGPHMLIGESRHRIFTLPPGRGFILIAYYDEGLVRVLRLPAPRAEFEVRPGVDLYQLGETHRLSPSDFGTHLTRIARGRSVDWSDVRGYLY